MNTDRRFPVRHRRMTAGRDRLFVTTGARMMPGRVDLPRRWAVVAAAVVLVVWNVASLAGLIEWARHGLPGNDWSILADLDPLSPYVQGSGFRWSLPAAWMWGWAVVPMGFLAWSLLHVAAVALIRPAWVALVVLESYPFWADTLSGNVLTFCFVAGWFALKGNRWGIVAFCVLAALVPRPLMIPVLGYLMLRYPVARIAFPAAAAFVVGTAFAAGQLDDWIFKLTRPYGEVDASFNLGPTRIFGLGWLAVGWPLAALAWWRGWYGVASLLFTPYINPYYAIFALLDLRHAASYVRPNRMKSSAAHVQGTELVTRPVAVPLPRTNLNSPVSSE